MIGQGAQFYSRVALAPASTSHTNINAPKIGQSAARPEAVQRAIEAGDDDETRQVFYTQIEEEIVTKERTETYIEHQYFLREYVIRVSSSQENYIRPLESNLAPIKDEAKARQCRGAMYRSCYSELAAAVLC